MKKLLTFLFAFLASIGLMNAKTEVIYSWESEGIDAVTEVGGIATGVIDETNVNKKISANGLTYYTLCLSGKKDTYKATTEPSAYINIVLDKPLAEGDVISMTACRNKNATGKNVTVEFIFDGDTNKSLASTEQFANINPDGENDPLPTTQTFTVPSSASGSTFFDMTRGSASTNLFITKIEITRETSSGPDPSETEDPWVPSYPHTWDFTKWDNETVTNLLDGSNWSDDEKGDNKTNITNGNCLWQVSATTDISPNKYVRANGITIEELKGLVYTNKSSNRSLAIALDYDNTSLGTYKGSKYLWFGAAETDYFIIPSVPAGAIIEMGVESHKTTEARGVQLKIGDEVLKAPDGTEVALPTTYEVKEWLVPTSLGELNDVTIHNVKGSHIYYITVTPNERKLANISWNTESTSLKIRETFTAPILNNPENLPITFSSSNEKVATVDEAGNISLVEGGVGKATISATFDGEATGAQYMTTTANTTIEVLTNVVDAYAWVEYDKVESIKVSKLCSVDKTSGTLAAGNLIDDDIINIKTVASAIYGNYGKEYLGNKFTGAVQLGRVSAAPTEDNSTGTIQSDNSPIIVTPKEDCKLVMFIRRQGVKQSFSDDDDVANNVITRTYHIGMAPNDGKSIYAAPHSAINTKLDQNLVFGAYGSDKATGNDYIYCAVEWDMTAGETYTLYALSTTIQMQGIGYYVERTEVPNNNFGKDYLAAPSLYPASKATMLPLDGCIKLTFASDVKVETAEAFKATLNDKDATLATDGKQVVVSYSGLEPLTKYTLTIPAGAIGNEESQIMEDLVYTFTTRQADVLFFSDFNVYPEEYFNKYGNLSANNEFIKSGSTDVTVEIGGMTFYSGEKGRMLAMPGLYNADSTKDYGPNDAVEDAGATTQAVQMIGGTGQYVEFPEMEGPIDVTFWLGNPETSSKTVTLKDEDGNTLASFTLPAAKRIKKFTYSYPYKGKVTFSLYNMGQKVDINDALFIKGEGEGKTYAALESVTAEGLELTENEGFDYSFNIPMNYEEETVTLKAELINAGLSVKIGETEFPVSEDGTFTLPVPDYNQYSEAVLTLILGDDALANKTEFKLRMFHIGSVILNGLTIDGLVADEETVATLQSEKKDVKIDGYVFTTLPKVEATFKGSNKVVEATGTLSDDKTSATYTFKGEVGGLTEDYSFTLSGMNIYQPAENDKSEILKYDKQYVDKGGEGIWSDGRYSITLNDGWDGKQFKMKSANPISLTAREDMKIKQIKMANMYENLGDPAKVASVTSEGANVYLPSATAFPAKADASNALDLVMNVENHVPGTPFVITFEGGKQPVAWFEFIYEPVEVAVSSISLDIEEATLEKGETITLKATIAPDYATNKTVTWTSSDEKVATVDENGMVTAVDGGEAVITVASISNPEVKAECKVTVTVPVTGLVIWDEDENPLDSTHSLTLITGDEYTLTEVVSPENATEQKVTWTSSDEAVAKIVDIVEEPHQVHIDAISAGEATITATLAGFTTSFKVTVSDPVVAVTGIKLDKTTAEMKTGETLPLTATIEPEDATSKEVKWTSSDNNIATVSAKGVVTALKAGKVTITATANKKTATCEITITDPVIEVEEITLDQSSATTTVGNELQLTATVTPTDATDATVTWTSSDEAVATVDQTGKVTAIAEGTATITAKAGDKTAECVVTVTNPVIEVEEITLDQSSATVTVGNELQLTATVTPENATDATVTWTSSDEAVATVDQTGKVTAIAVGTATITAKAGDKTAECVVTVTNPVIEVEEITLDQSSATVTVGNELQLTATVTPTDATDATVTWTSSDEAVATVDQTGKVTAIAVGTATITAKAGDKTAECVVTVSKTSAAELIGFDPEAEIKVFDLNGIFVGESMEGLQQGTYIIRQGNNVKKVRIR